MRSLMAYTLATNLELRFLETDSKCDVLSTIMFIINFPVSLFTIAQTLPQRTEAMSFTVPTPVPA